MNYKIETKKAFRIVGISAPLKQNPDPANAVFEVWIPVVKKEG